MPLREKGRSGRWRLIVRKECWCLTWIARLLLLFAMIGAIVLTILNIHSFLAVTAKVNSPLLVVEGWISADALRQAEELFRTGFCETVFTTGGPTQMDFDSSDLSDTYASVAAGRLVQLGIPKGRIRLVPSSPKQRDRTYASAIALAEWFRAHEMPVHAFNVITVGVHGRRTRLLYERAFNSQVAVGIISTENREYDPNRWWRYSEGLKEVIGEGSAYLYARFSWL